MESVHDFDRWMRNCSHSLKMHSSTHSQLILSNCNSHMRIHSIKSFLAWHAYHWLKSGKQKASLIRSSQSSYSSEATFQMLATTLKHMSFASFSRLLQLKTHRSSTSCESTTMTLATPCTIKERSRLSSKGWSSINLSILAITRPNILYASCQCFIARHFLPINSTIPSQ